MEFELRGRMGETGEGEKGNRELIGRVSRGHLGGGKKLSKGQVGRVL